MEVAILTITANDRDDKCHQTDDSAYKSCLPDKYLGGEQVCQSEHHKQDKRANRDPCPRISVEHIAERRPASFDDCFLPLLYLVYSLGACYRQVVLYVSVGRENQ